MRSMRVRPAPTPACRQPTPEDAAGSRPCAAPAPPDRASCLMRLLVCPASSWLPSLARSLALAESELSLGLTRRAPPSAPPLLPARLPDPSVRRPFSSLCSFHSSASDSGSSPPVGIVAARRRAGHADPKATTPREPTCERAWARGRGRLPTSCTHPIRLRGGAREAAQARRKQLPGPSLCCGRQIELAR